MSKQEYVKQTAENRKAIEAQRKREAEKRMLPHAIAALVAFNQNSRIK